jgi:hypothetical protein
MALYSLVYGLQMALGWLWVAVGGFARTLAVVGTEFCFLPYAFCVRKSPWWPPGTPVAIPPTQRPI